MFPGPRISTSGQQQLSRLAEIAEAVSMHQRAVQYQGLPSNGVFNVAHFMAQGQPASFETALRKRSVDETNNTSVEDQERTTAPTPPAKRSKEENVQLEDDNEDDKDVRFREYQAEIWSEKFEDLCEFRRQYGHCHVPHSFEENSPLAQWVKRQRYQYKLKLEGKRSTLSDERVKLLNQIGFIWNSHDVVWEERWHELIAFKNAHGNCIVPSNYDKNPQLAVWVKRQRRQFKFYQENKPTSMTSERIVKLDQLGFAWDCRKNNTGTSDGVASRVHPDGVCVAPSLPVVPPGRIVPTAKPPVSLKTNTTIPLSAALRAGGFPFPKCPTIATVGTNSGTISAFKQQQQLRQQYSKDSQSQHPSKSTEAIGTTVSEYGAAGTGGPYSSKPPPTCPAQLDMSKLPREFLSFSTRTFTKFPKINLPKALAAQILHSSSGVSNINMDFN